MNARLLLAVVLMASVGCQDDDKNVVTVRVKAPSGVEGWGSADSFDLADAAALWP